MSLVTILPSGKTVEAGEGMTILAAILQADRISRISAMATPNAAPAIFSCSKVARA